MDNASIFQGEESQKFFNGPKDTLFLCVTMVFNKHHTKTVVSNLHTAQI